MAKKKSGEDLAARWAKIHDEVVTAATQALFDAGVLVRDTASKLAPKDTGKLAGSYGVKLRHKGADPVAVIGTSVKYATYVEFARDIKGHAYGKNLPEPARALFKALDQNEDKILALITEGVDKGLDKGLDKVGGA